MADLTTTLARFLRQLVTWPAAFDGDVISLETNTTTAANVSTNETDLMTYSLPGGSLAVNGQKVRITGWGTYAANGNTKTVRIRFGSTVVSTRASTGNNVAWWIQALVVRTGAATQVASGVQLESGNAGQPTATSPSETLADAITIKLTGQSGTASDDVTARGFIVEWLA